MNEIYLRNQYRKLQGLNLLFVAELIGFELILYWYGEHLAFNNVVTGILVVCLLGLFSASHLEHVRDHYPIAMAITSGVVIFAVFIYGSFFSGFRYTYGVEYVFLLTFLCTVSRDHFYQNFNLAVMTGVFVIVGVSDSPVRDKVLNLLILIAILGIFIIRQRSEKQVNREYYELFNIQRMNLENIHEAYALHEVIWNDAHSGIVDYRFVHVNHAFEKMTSLVGHEIVGKKVMDILPNTEPYWLEAYGEVVIHQNSTSFINYSKEFDKYFKVSVYPVSEDQFATVFMDVTMVIKTEKALKDKVKDAKRANDFKSQFLRDVNHKLRTPLNGMMGMAQLIAMEELPGDTRELFDVMVAEMDHSRNILNQIAEYIDLKEDTYQITQNNINEDISEAIDSVNRNEGCTIDVIIEDSELEGLFYEKGVFGRVLKTLISNGIKHSESEKITIKVEEDRRKDGFMKFLLVSVMDYGKGISENQQRMIFNQLHHQDFINIYREQGHMSLPLCRELVKHVGGDLVCSSSETQGAVFTIRLPIFENI